MTNQRTLPVLVLILLVTGCWTASNDGPMAVDDFPYHIKLDDNYNLKWNFNSSHIMFQMKVKTLGYIGFGISNNGKMYPSDIIIGWMDGADKVHFHDRYAKSHMTPSVDKQQDWHLLAFKKEDINSRTMSVIRRINTCDDEDIPITRGTARIIYTYNDNVPVSDDNIPPHSAYSRGARSALLLDAPADETDNKLPDGLTTIDMVRTNYSVPSQETTYACTLLKLPPLNEKHHIIRYEPAIQKGHENIVHHMVLYYCPMPYPDSRLNTSFECYVGAPTDFCFFTFLAWAIGGTGFNFPSKTGYSLGAPNDPGYFKLETHYTNVDKRSGYVDSSGIRLFLTKKLRQYDAGMLRIGAPTDKLLLIPPNIDNFHVTAHCPSKCLDEATKATGGQITIFADFLHAHLLARRMVQRHVRDGVELPPIVMDDNYDFDYQETRALTEERVVKTGDILITDCYYDSRKRSAVTYGGLATTDEMCIGFALYYPKSTLNGCQSKPAYSKDGKTYYPNGLDNFVQTTNWSIESNRLTFVYNVQESDVTGDCLTTNIERLAAYQPLKFREYVPENICLNKDNGGHAFGSGVIWPVYLACIIGGVIMWT